MTECLNFERVWLPEYGHSYAISCIVITWNTVQKIIYWNAMKFNVTLHQQSAAPLHVKASHFYLNNDHLKSLSHEEGNSSSVILLRHHFSIHRVCYYYNQLYHDEILKAAHLSYVGNGRQQFVKLILSSWLIFLQTSGAFTHTIDCKKHLDIAEPWPSKHKTPEVFLVFADCMMWPCDLSVMKNNGTGQFPLPALWAKHSRASHHILESRHEEELLLSVLLTTFS